MRWTETQVLQLISLYQEKRILWDPTHPEYKLNKFRTWSDIAKVLNIEVDYVDRKMDSLLTSFRRERQREGTTFGMGNGEVYHSKWFAFNSMQFLNDKFKPRKTKNIITENAAQNVLMDDNIVSELPNTEENVSDEAANITHEQIPTSKPQNANKRKLFVSPQKRATPEKIQRSEDSIINQAFNLLKTIEAKKNESTTKDDDCDIFGKYIASELKTFDEHVRVQIKHTINNVLYEAQMGKFQKQVPHDNQSARN